MSEQSDPQTAGIYPVATWRLVKSGHLDGPTNMAVDEAILEAVAAGTSPPTLRFYGWEPACLSLGFGQAWSVIDAEFCEISGWGIVRRPTGGRAILHVDELTYSVCAPVGEPRVRGGVLESYHRLSAALLAGLRLLGLSPAQAIPDPKKGDESGAACFDAPSNYEITIDGKKLVGSAQVRKKQVVLQHGTLPLHGDVTRITSALTFVEAEERQMLTNQLNKRATTLENVLGRRVNLEEATQFLQQGFAQSLNLSFEGSDLSTNELKRAGQLRAEKYAHDSWTKRL